jgi:uncharacterized protein (DUF849 family)
LNCREAGIYKNIIKEEDFMYFTDDSLLPENMQPLIIQAAPYGPAWLPGDFPEDIPVSWEAQVQKAVDCYNAGATLLHLHVRDPKTGHGSKNLQEFSDQIARIRKAAPKLLIQVGGSISFAPAEGKDKAAWLGYDTRHMLAELTPKPDQVTIQIGTIMMNVTELMTADDVAGTSLADPKMYEAYREMVTDSTPLFYVEHLKRLRANGIQPHFMLSGLENLETVERLIRQGLYMGPLNTNMVSIGGGAPGPSPYNLVEYIRRSPHGSVPCSESLMRSVPALNNIAIAMGIHVRVGIEDNIWRRKGEKMTSVQQIEQMVRMAKELGPPIATPEQAKEIMKIGTWYNSVEETLFNLGLPPNRKGGQQGFLTYETDGKIRPKASLVGEEHKLIGA